MSTHITDLNCSLPAEHLSLTDCADLAGHPGTGHDGRTSRRDELYRVIADM